MAASKLAALFVLCLAGAGPALGSDLTTDTSASGRPGINPPKDLLDAVSDTASDALYVYTAPARMSWEDLPWVAGAAAIFAALYAYDGDTYDAIKRNEFEDGYEWLRDTGEFFEPLGFQGFLNKYLIGSLIVGYVGRIDFLREVPADMLESFIISQIGKETANQVIGRNGPLNELGPRSFEGGRSLPSGHSITVMTVATVLSHHIRYRPFQIGIHAAAGSVLLQRISSDHHWASDVFTGALFGYLVTRAILDRKEERRLQVSPMKVGDGAVGLGVRVAF